MASIRDVAARAGVSTATVVRVLHGGAPVSSARTDRVMQAVEELDYVTNGVAASLTRGQTRLLGLLVSDIANPFMAQVARGLEDEAARHGYQVLIASSDFEPEREAPILTSFARRTVDAVALVCTSAATRGVARLVRNGIPTVLIDRRPPGASSVPLVHTDSWSAMRGAVRYLTDLGHVDLAMIAGPQNIVTASQRLAAFVDVCAAEGLRPRTECMQVGGQGIDGGQQAMNSLLSLRSRPTAVISYNNMYAIGALGALQRQDVRLPDHLSLLTFDDTDLFPYVNPPLTAIAQPAYDIGLQAALMLFRRLDGGDEPEDLDVTMPTELRVRGSCGPPTSTGDPRPSRASSRRS